MGCSACDTKDEIIRQQRAEINRLCRVIEVLEDIIRRLHLKLASLIARVDAVRAFGADELERPVNEAVVKPRWKLPHVLVGRLQVVIDNARSD
jgi:hypothetical protein